MLLISKALRYGPRVTIKGITQFYLPPTHEPYLPLLPSRKVLIAPTHEGMARLSWSGSIVVCKEDTLVQFLFQASHITFKTVPMD